MPESASITRLHGFAAVACNKLANLLLLIGSVVLVLLALEALLRLYPALIDESILMEFSKSLRRDVAAQLNLPLKQARRCISQEERYDNGPELCFAYPDFEWVQRLDAIDIQYGATERTLQDNNGFCNSGNKTLRRHEDVVFIGDSFTWCTAVAPEATFAALLENTLDATTYNLGVPGVGPYEYLEILRRYGLDYSPRIVVMSIYEGNDLRDGVRYWKSREKRGREVQYETAGESAGNGDSSFIERIGERSYSLNFIVASVEFVLNRMAGDKINFHYRVTVQGESVPMNVVNADTDEVKNARLLARGKVSMDVWREALAGFAALGRTHHFTPVLVYVPSAYTSYDSSAVFEDSSVAVDVTAQSDAQRAYLEQLAQELDIALLDLTPFLQKAVDSAPLAYFPANVHLTGEGHALIARALQPKLQALLAGGDDQGE